MSKWKRWIAVPIVILAVSYPIAWVIAKNSDAYAEAERFLRGNAVVADRLGRISSVGLTPFGYSIRFTGARGTAHFEMALEASKASGKAYVELERRGNWEVRIARLIGPGQQVTEIKGT